MIVFNELSIAIGCALGSFVAMILGTHYIYYVGFYIFVATTLIVSAIEKKKK